MRFRLAGAVGLGALLLFGAMDARAQLVPQQQYRQRSWWEEPPSRIFTSISYAMAVPFSSAREMATTFSPLGFNIDVRYFPRPLFSAGISFGWQNFNHETSEVSTLGNVSIQGKQLRYVNTMPILAGGHVYLNLIPHVRPFAGFSLGTYYMERRLDIGLYALESGTWHFGIAPEAGISANIGHFMPVVAVRYNHAFSSSDSGDLSFLNINLGLAFN